MAADIGKENQQYIQETNQNVGPPAQGQYLIWVFNSTTLGIKEMNPGMGHPDLYNVPKGDGDNTRCQKPWEMRSQYHLFKSGYDMIWLFQIVYVYVFKLGADNPKIFYKKWNNSSNTTKTCITIIYVV